MNIQVNDQNSNNPQNSLTTNSRPDEYSSFLYGQNATEIKPNYITRPKYADEINNFYNYDIYENDINIEKLKMHNNYLRAELNKDPQIMDENLKKILETKDSNRILEYLRNYPYSEEIILKFINSEKDDSISNTKLNNTTDDSTFNENIFFTDFEKNMFPILEELLALNGLLDQHPTTGRYISAETDDGNVLTFDALKFNDDEYKKKLVKIINGYRNKLFGSPFQFLDSVDARFSSTNKYVGYEFLRNFLLHSAILHIYPGNTRYTGGDDSRFESISRIINALSQDAARSNEYKDLTNKFQAPWNEVYATFKNLETTKGEIEKDILQLFMRSKLQRRLFGISFQYESYLRYVKLMCHGVALLLKLTGSTYLQNEYPNGTFVNDNVSDPNERFENITNNDKNLLTQGSINYKFQSFKNINWGNYRMIEDSSTVVNEIEVTTKKAMDRLAEMIGTLSTDAFKKALGGSVELAWDAIKFLWFASPIGAWQAVTKNWNNGEQGDFFDKLSDSGKDYFKKLGDISEEGLHALGKMAEGFGDVLREWNALRYDIAERVQSIEFMVEPVNATESYQNDIGPSRLKSSVDSVNSLGAEISFITNSGATTGLANTLVTSGQELVNSAMNVMSQVATPFTGNFLSNLFSGAIGAITGNRFIYPDIYQNSSSHADYNFKVNLSSPYGDIYNYYMNIIVPLCHLQALCLPKLKTSNSINSPFLVRAFIPGLMTCEMGIIDSMNVIKNPQNNRVSVNNFPLDVQVTFTIRELYHNLAISPTDDGLSYINNETLKDYLCNMAGIYPTFNREIELNLVAADMLASQFNLWQNIKRNGGASFLSFLGLLN